MAKPIITETHERRSLVTFGKADLSRILRIAACQECGIPDSDAVRVDIRFEDETAGSPPYKVGTRAIITVTEDQLMLPRPMVENANG